MPRVSEQISCENPKVSVKMITYNHEPFIAQAIESVLMQETDFPVELIIGEDYSPDGTREIVKRYAAKYPNVIRALLPERNLGIRANSAGVSKACRGQYIAFLEGDDYWTSPHKIKKQVDFLDTHLNYSASAHQTKQLLEDGTPGKIFGQFDKLDVGVVDTIAPLSPWHTTSFVCRREFFYLPDWISSIISVDMAIFTIVASRGPVRVFPEVMSVYRKHVGGITSDAKVIANFHQNRIELMEHLDDHLKYEYHDRFQEVIHSHRAAIRAAKSRWFYQLASQAKKKLRSLLK